MGAPRKCILLAALLAALLATGLSAGCSDGGGGAAMAPAPAGNGTAASPAREAVATAADAAPADFEGTMQQVVISLDAEAVRKVAGSTDLQAVLDLPPDRLVEAVNSGEIAAESILKSTLEIDGRMGRLQTEGQPDFSILDGERMATHVVVPSDRMIMTMDPARMAAAGAANGKTDEPVDMGAEEIGDREIRGFDTTGYRFEFMGNIATVWLSEELDAETGGFFDIWSALNPLGPVMDVGEGAPVRAVMVNPESLAGKSSFMPAYTITEFHDVASGEIPDDRFTLPEGYRQQGLADLGRGAQ